MGAEIIYLPTPTDLTPEQREHWHEQAAYWAVRQEDAERALEYASRRRESALRILGMLGAENGLIG